MKKVEDMTCNWELGYHPRQPTITMAGYLGASVDGGRSVCGLKKSFSHLCKIWNYFTRGDWGDLSNDKMCYSVLGHGGVVVEW